MNRRFAGPGLPMYASNVMLELVRALELHMLAGPTTQGKELMRLSAGCEFEGFGRASESWDVVWTLTLPFVRHYWRSTDGWKLGTNPTHCMTFKGRDDADCLKAALQFLKDVGRPERPLLAKGALSATALDEESPL